MSDGKAVEQGAGKRFGRVDAVDAARGLALFGMAAYHLTWDLADLRLVSPVLPFTPEMRLLSHSVASAFLALVGVSLALAHPYGLNIPAFWRRLAIICAAAALVTGASFIFAPGDVIFFGILHCIVAASLLAAPFVAAPPWASLVAGAAAIAAPLVVHSTLFDKPWLLWLGLGEALPNTLDWRPLLPWAGVVFLGLGLARTLMIKARLASPDRWRAVSLPARTLCWAGRHSLPIYLVHQPILIGVLWALVNWGGLAPKPDNSAFLAACRSACVNGGSGREACKDVCQCVADAIEGSGEADKLASLDEASRAELKRLVEVCKAQ